MLGTNSSGIICGLRDNGCYQSFRGGEILWSDATGAQVSRLGAIRTSYRTLAAENGKLGYPTGPETCGLKDNGCYQAFQNGYINWTSSTGAQPSPNGPIRQAWAQTGYESGKLGYPISSVICNPAEDSCYQGFQNGYINWTNSTGAQITGGAIRQAWAQTGYESGKLGYPSQAPLITLLS